MPSLRVFLSVIGALVPAVFVLLAVGGRLGWQGDGAPLVAHVTLDNRCTVPDRYFVVQDTVSGVQRSFVNGSARIDSRAGNPLTLQLQDRFTDVRYLGDSAPARADMTLVARCNGGGSRLSGISSAFK
jgi:hypothetical protein